MGNIHGNIAGNIQKHVSNAGKHVSKKETLNVSEKTHMTQGFEGYGNMETSFSIEDINKEYIDCATPKTL
jgi:hypothetical protein